MGKPIPITPSTQISGGGLDGVTGKIVEARAVTHDYGGAADVEVPALKITVEDEDGVEREQMYKAGDGSKIMPSEDGLMFESVDEEKEFDGLGKRTLAGTFLRILDETSKGRFNAYAAKVGDLTALEGIVATFEDVPKPKYGAGFGGKSDHFPCITKILEAPWSADGKVKASAGKGSKRTMPVPVEEDEDEDAPKRGVKGKGRTAKAEVEDEEVAEPVAEAFEDEEEDENSVEVRARKALKRVLKSNGAMQRAKAAQAVKEMVQDEEEDWREIVSAVLSEKFIKKGAKDGLWKFDGMKVGPAK